MRKFCRIGVLLMCGLLLSNGIARAQSSELVIALSGLLERLNTREGQQLIVVPPAENDLPIGRDVVIDEVAAVLEQAIRLSGSKIKVRPLPRDINVVFAVLNETESQNEWQDKLQRYLSTTSVEYGLLTKVIYQDNALFARLTLTELGSGNRRGVTKLLPISIQKSEAKAPLPALRSVFQDILNDFIDISEDDLGLLPFEMSDTGLTNPATRALEGVVQQAWSEAARRNINLFKRPKGIVYLLDPSRNTPFHLTGALSRISPDKVLLNLGLHRGRAVVMSKQLVLRTDELPIRAKNAVNPKFSGIVETGFKPVLQALQPYAAADLTMDLVGRKGSRIYRRCEEQGSDVLSKCELLHFSLTAGSGGHSMCFALGDDRKFTLLRPNSIAPKLYIAPGDTVILPNGKTDNGQIEVWPALGPAGTVLLACAVYKNELDLPTVALSNAIGEQLSPSAIQHLARVISDSVPSAVDWKVVSIK